MASLDSGTDNMIIYGCPPFVVAAKTLEPCIIIASFSAFMALIISSYARQLRSLSRLLFYWALKYFHLLQFSVPPFRRIAILSAENEKAIIASKLLEPNFIRMTVTALAPPRLSGRLVLPAMAEKIIFSGGLSRSYIPPAGRLLFKHQHLNASPYGFAGAYRQCRCVITVCTRKSPFCHKVCNFNKIYCPFFRCNINKDNVHKSIISWSRSVHEKRCIGVSIKLNIYRKCWKISNINEDITI